MYGDEAMLRKIYDLLLDMGLLNNYTAFDYLVSKFSLLDAAPNRNCRPDRKSLLSKHSNTVLVNNKSSDYYTNIEQITEEHNIASFRHRTFRNRHEFYILNDDITFQVDSQCMECHGPINLQNVSLV